MVKYFSISIFPVIVTLTIDWTTMYYDEIAQECVEMTEGEYGAREKRNLEEEAE